ncbi:hypothetical protein MD484_g5692, partial [Candolleomyces efflorescens]
MPNLQEARAIQQDDLNDLKSRITTLTLSQLQDLKKELQERVRALSPVSRIPAELLGEIFSMALPDSLNEWNREQLLAFCRVCKPWREAALATRWLWSGVIVDTDQMSYAFDKIVSWFQRSGDSAKRLHVVTKNVDEWDVFCGEMGSECKLGSAVLAKFLTDGPVLDHLCVVCKDIDCYRNLVDALYFYSALFKPRFRPWDRLRSLDLRFTYSDQVWEPILKYIPSSVTSLGIQFLSVGATLEDESLEASLPQDTLQHLTSVQLVGPLAWRVQALRLLQSCENAETVSFLILSNSSFDSDDPGLLPLQPIPHLELHTLKLALPSNALIHAISSFKTPYLVTLDIRPYSHASGVAEAVLALVHRSNCQSTLRHLRLRNSDPSFTEGQLTCLLSGLPFITHLTLYGIPGNVVQGAFQKLGSTLESDPNIMFQLEVLELVEPPEPEFRLDLPVGPGQDPVFRNLKGVRVIQYD